MRITHWCTVYNKKLEKTTQINILHIFYWQTADCNSPILARNIHLSIKLQPVTQLHIVSLDVPWFIFLCSTLRPHHPSDRLMCQGWSLMTRTGSATLIFNVFLFLFFFTPVSVRKISPSPQSGIDKCVMFVRAREKVVRPALVRMNPPFKLQSTPGIFLPRGSSVRIHHL